MTAQEAIEFWSSMVATLDGRERIRVLLDNAPKCQFPIDTMEMRIQEVPCNIIASKRIDGRWFCASHVEQWLVRE